MNPYLPNPNGSGFKRPAPTVLGGGLPSPSHTLLSGLIAPKRSVFVSYHHGDNLLSGDQAYYDQLSKVASAQFQLMTDKSLRTTIGSDNHDYIIQRIRTNHINGSSCTIVLCGAHTYQRKYVDWEIKATLDKGHGIVAVYLPTAPSSDDGITVPRRLYPNIKNDYAYWVSWEAFTQSAKNFKACIEFAIARSNNAELKKLIHNPKEIKKQNG